MEAAGDSSGQPNLSSLGRLPLRVGSFAEIPARADVARISKEVSLAADLFEDQGWVREPRSYETPPPLREPKMGIPPCRPLRMTPRDLARTPLRRDRAGAGEHASRRDGTRFLGHDLAEYLLPIDEREFVHVSSIDG
jgi:hypothetical protein